MSYCRFSSMNWTCDLYVYDGQGGITIQVAANRYVSDTPCPPMPSMEQGATAWQIADAHTAQEKWRDNDAKLVPIGLPHDGAEYVGLTNAEAAAILTMLKAEGYRMPEGLIEDFATEAA